MMPYPQTPARIEAGQSLPLDTRWDWNWADGFMPEVFRLLRLCAMDLIEISVASAQQDVKKATDMLITITAVHPIAIGVRLRRPKFTYRDLTIRAERSSGATTELEKLRTGNADYYLYGWTTGWSIREWMLIDLAKLRASGLLERKWKLIRNYDHTTAFIAISYEILRNHGCVKRSQIGGW